MAGNIDLHTHTMYSDGSLTPNQLVVKAKEIGLKAIALTDHDNIAATEVAMLKGKELGVEVIPAIELTAYLDENSDVYLHIWVISLMFAIGNCAKTGILSKRA